MNEKAPMARLVRALTSDTHIRMAALDARPLWDGIRRGHPHLESEACACLTEVLATSLLLQSRSLFSERLQILIRSVGQARAVVADSWPDGLVRGMLDVSEEVKAGAYIQGPGVFQVMRSTLKGEPIVGKLPLAEGSVATQAEHYLQQSEQVQASLYLWCDPATGEAGGLIAEPLPGCSSERIRRLVDALEGLDVVPNWERDAEFLIRWVNQGTGATVLSTHDIEYRCRCGKESLLATLAGFPSEQIEELFHEGGSVEVKCEYCGAAYLIARDEVASRSRQNTETRQTYG